MVRVIGLVAGVLGLLIVAAIVGWILLGGGEPEPASPGGAAPAGAPTGGSYLDRTLATREFAERTLWEAEVASSIKMHELEHGSMPASLDELEQLRDLPEGWGWDYDPQTGAARIVEVE
jgi:hypothetical protein